MTAVILTGLHLIVCVTVWLLWKKGRLLHSRYPIMVAVICMPVTGVLLVGLEELVLRKKKNGTREIALQGLKVEDIKYKRIEVNSDENPDMAVPLEEAMYVDDSAVSRRLMLELLQHDPDQYIDLLQKVSDAEDTELIHYATTTMLEIQGRYETKLNELFEALKEEPDNTVFLRKCRKELKAYIESGLLSDRILQFYREHLDEVLRKLVAVYPERFHYRTEYCENLMQLGEMERARQCLKQIEERWPEEEKGYQLQLEYYWYERDGEKIREILNVIDEKHIYLSSSGKQWYEFWKQQRTEL